MVAEYDSILGIIDYEKNMIEEYISQSEAKGYITSAKYYEALADHEQENINKLKEERDKLLSSLETAMKSGTIEKESEAWYEMCAQIDEVTLAIEESNTAILDYANSIRDIEWEVFDLLQEKISQIVDESNFLIDLMSNDKLYDDRGQLTNEGMSTMGLHGSNYNVYMEQAEKYAQEMLNIDKKLAEDPYNQDLIERRQELLELQQDSILAAEDEKQAIVDMVQEGIDLELDALQELIDSYNEALDSQKDLYDYQKKVSKQTKEIATLEKQLAAYAGDTSEEAKSKIQQIKVSLEEAKSDLEETEYDRYVSDQKQLLDDLYTEYEDILNQRMDNIELLISDMITEINTNAAMINSTLVGKADSVGYTMSDSMQSIWNNESGEDISVLATYSQGIRDEVTDVSNTLDSISVNIKDMIATLYGIATQLTDSITSATESTQANTAPDPKPAPSPPQSSSGSSSNSNEEYSGIGINSYDGSDNDNKEPTEPPVEIVTPKTPSGSNKTDNYIADLGLPEPDSKSINIGFNSSARDEAKKTDGASANASYAEFKKQQQNKDINALMASAHISYDEAKKILGYSSGGVVDYTGFAMVHGSKKKSETIFDAEDSSKLYDMVHNGKILSTQTAITRPSDGALLTPFLSDNRLLGSVNSNGVLDLINNPADFIRDTLNLDNLDVPMNQVSQNTYHQTLEKVIFSLPNVKNYEELLVSLQKDKRFEKLLLSVTADQMVGKSSLAKYKAVR